jgi:phytoene dehydrogenase-like protein
MPENRSYEVVIIGGGHNGLVAACYLAKAGLTVAILEKNGELGGATVSQKVFPDYEARLSRYAYLVSLLPDKIVSDLELDFVTLSRSVASFTPTYENEVPAGLLITTQPSDTTEADFQALTGSHDEYQKWMNFYSDVSCMAKVIAPTMLEPLPTRSELKAQVNHPIWEAIVEHPIGEILEKHFASDLVRGIVLTDGLIGTFADAHSLAANKCFIYHLIGNGSGEWKVPLGGMGGLVTKLKSKASALGVEFFTETEVTSVLAEQAGYEIQTSDNRQFRGKYLLANCAPQELARLMNQKPPASLEGSQMKINMLLRKLPRLKSGVDPEKAFAGTFHFDEKYSQLQLAYQQSSSGQIPDRIPAEMYCHTLTDSSILSGPMVEAGFHTLTLFAIHTPAALFDEDHDRTKAIITSKLLSQLNEYLLDPIEECLAVAADGSFCIEAKSPLEIEKEIGLPRGNIFHKDLAFPFREDHEPRTWGVETEFPNLFICGAGAIRGGGVSGIPGHNAAAAVLEAEGGARKG